jgi:alkanesulfonate monooxygenase SsuD/methylene tetrahydromethanopterin reductase-like flavin-dependent oxidoreductase (luciferase family)
VRYCLNLPIGGRAAHPRILADFAVVAEDAGWDAVFVEDYIIYQNRQDMPAYDPWVALAAMAVATSRIRLGTMVTPLARRRPWKLAREAVTLDHLSDGRLTLCIGVGDPQDFTYSAFGEETDARVRAAIVDEGLEIITAMWSGKPFSFRGKHFTVSEMTCLPGPVQEPRIPIWIGGAYPNPRPLRRAVRWDGACLYQAAEPGSAQDSEESLAPEQISAIRSFAAAHRTGAGPFDIVAGGPERGPDHDRTRDLIRQCAEAGATWFSEWIPPGDPAAMRASIARGPVRI